MDIQKEVFYEIINVKKLAYICENRQQYENTINEQEKEMRRINKHSPDAWISFNKMLREVYIPSELQGTEYGMLRITYKKGRESNGVGRVYCRNGIGIQPIVACVRHTICEGLWTDIDQVNSHPTILRNLMNKYGYYSNLLNECLDNREVFLKKVMDDERINRNAAKTKVIAVINGAKYNSTTLSQLTKEIKPFIEFITNHSDYESIMSFVKKTYKDNIEGKVISRILQIIENDMLECYLEFFMDKGFINKEKLEVSLIFDGFQLRCHEGITQGLLDECRQYTLNKLGFDIELKIKPFDGCLDIPDDYKKIDFEDMIKKETNRFKLKAEQLQTTQSHLVNAVMNSEGAHFDVSNICKFLFKDYVKYDDKTKQWFYCNQSNIWKEDISCIKLQQYIPTTISMVFVEAGRNNSHKAINAPTEELKQYYETLAQKCFNMSNRCKQYQYIKNVMDMSKSLLVESDFINKLDSNGHLFAFNDKLFDFKTNQVRDIQPTDYIFTTCDYCYPEDIDEDDTKFLTKYFDTLFPDVGLREYVLDSFCSTLNGEKSEQYFNIHSGSGSNSKTTLMNLYQSATGSYSVNISAETFTKPKKSSNDTGELYKCKGKRNVCVNEPESYDDKLQVAILKKIADDSTQTIIARSLYSNPIEFKIQFQLNIFCNNEPELSSVDGGIARRLRSVSYKVKFVKDPNPEDPYQSLLDASIMKFMKSNGVRDAFIRMLLDRWTNRVSKVSIINVPEEVVEKSNAYIEDCNPVLGFINEHYEITNNKGDWIKSSKIYGEFLILHRDKQIGDRRFKNDMLAISGISYKRSGCSKFYGLKKKVKEDSDSDNDEE
jgi:phage/plasmid-associated DNA primase